MDIKKFKPDGTGKYSPNFYRWLTSPRFKHSRHVFQTKNSLNGEGFRDVWVLPEIIVGEGKFSEDGSPLHIGGHALLRIVSIERGVLSRGFSYSAKHFRDITDQFWATYERVGRCAWDAKHVMPMIGDEDRYTYEGNTRVCNWCGAVHEMRRETKVEVVKREIWAPYRDSVPAAVSYPSGSCGEYDAPHNC